MRTETRRIIGRFHNIIQKFKPTWISKWEEWPPFGIILDSVNCSFDCNAVAEVKRNGERFIFELQEWAEQTKNCLPNPTESRQLIRLIYHEIEDFMGNLEVSIREETLSDIINELTENGYLDGYVANIRWGAETIESSGFINRQYYAEWEDIIPLIRAIDNDAKDIDSIIRGVLKVLNKIIYPSPKNDSFFLLDDLPTVHNSKQEIVVFKKAIDQGIMALNPAKSGYIWNGTKTQLAYLISKLYSNIIPYPKINEIFDKRITPQLVYHSNEVRIRKGDVIDELFK